MDSWWYDHDMDTSDFIIYGFSFVMCGAVIIVVNGIGFMVAWSV